MGGGRGGGRRRDADRARRPPRPSRGARARARGRDMGAGQPLRPTGEGHRSEAAASVGRPGGDRVSLSGQACRREARRLADRALRHPDRVRCDRRGPAHGVHRRRDPAWSGRGGDPLVGAAAGHAPPSSAARATRSRLPREPASRDLRRLRSSGRVRASVRADERVRRGLPDRRPDRPAPRREPGQPRPHARGDVARAVRGRAGRQHLPAGGRAAVQRRRALRPARAGRTRDRSARRDLRPRPRGAVGLPHRDR